MQTEEHTFPLPDVETHKLDHLQEALGTASNGANAKEFVQANRWWLLAATALSGIAVGWLIQRQRD